MVNLKNYIRTLNVIVIALFIVSLSWTTASFAEETTKKSSDRLSIGEKFQGESLSFQVSFWILDNVATATISVVKTGDFYVATLKAKTSGLAWWLTNREDKYISVLQEVDGGNRFRTVSFEEWWKIGSKVRRNLTEMRYPDGKVKVRKWRKGRNVEQYSMKIKDGVAYDDPLCAFYNFRYGVYGISVEGASFSIPTFPKKDEVASDILLSILTEDEFDKRIKSKHIKKHFGNPVSKEYYMADVKLDKDILGSKSGLMEILFNEKLVPVWAVAKDVALFGDVKGILIEEPAKVTSNP
ncbi:MAG: DUF3108 domain-containing protein [Deltaproteobacteria bacterium]|nr:DUF3108 domain-containing protein [Deltaproteobacteria bacterium]